MSEPSFSGPYVFKQDESMHWYRVPKEEEEEFDRLQKKARDAARGSDEFYDAVNEFDEKFGPYRGSRPSNTEFYLLDS